MYLKHFVSYLLLPFPLVLMVLAVGISLLWFTARQRTGKVLVTVGAAFLLLISWRITNDLALAPLRYFPPLVNLADAAGVRWIVVLGCGFSVRPGVPATSRLDAGALERLVEGVRLYRQLPGAKLVLSGGYVIDKVSQTEVLAEAAESLGVPRADMVLEARTFDTQDEARLIREIVGDDPFVLVTSNLHMRRSMRLFEKQGLKPIAAPAGYWPSGGPLLPHSDYVVKADQADHEYVGMLWSLLRGTL